MLPEVVVDADSPVQEETVTAAGLSVTWELMCSLVRKMLRSLRVDSAIGPDGVLSRVLKMCAEDSLASLP